METKLLPVIHLGEPDYLGFPEPDSFMVNITVISIEEGEVQFYESDTDIIIDEPFEIKGQWKNGWYCYQPFFCGESPDGKAM